MYLTRNVRCRNFVDAQMPPFGSRCSLCIVISRTSVIVITIHCYISLVLIWSGMHIVILSTKHHNHKRLISIFTTLTYHRSARIQLFANRAVTLFLRILLVIAWVKDKNNCQLYSIAATTIPNNFIKITTLCMRNNALANVRDSLQRGWRATLRLWERVRVVEASAYRPSTAKRKST